MKLLSIQNMKLRQAMVEVFNPSKIYNRSNQTESDYSNFWKIFIAFIIIFLITILFVCCYRYLHWKIYTTCIRCLKSQIKRNNTDDNFPIVKANETESGTKQKHVRSNIFSKFQTKSSIQNDKEHTNKSSKLKTLLQERKKLLASCDNNITDLTEQLSLKMSFSFLSLPDPKVEGVPNHKNKRFAKCPERYKNNQLNTYSIKDIDKISRKEIDICFSETDVKFLAIPMSSKKSNIIKQDTMVLCKWNSENLDNYHKEGNNMSSKLIELKYEDIESLSDTVKKLEIPTIKSNHMSKSIMSKNLVNCTNYFSETITNRSNIFPEIVFEKLQRSSNSHVDLTLTDNSSLDKISIESVRNIPKKETDQQILSERLEDKSVCFIKKTAINEINKFKKPQLRMKKGIKSSIDVPLNYFKENPSININNAKHQMKELYNSRRVFKSEGNLIKETASSNMNYSDLRNLVAAEKHFNKITNESIRNTEGTSVQLHNDSDTNETYDELGILFSRYLKFQARPCRRKYCSLSRHLKQRTLHSEQKCQAKYKYYRIFPYDQRPACNNGNVCADTYDEIKLMCSLPSDRNNIYRSMFKRRKQFLNQPCIPSN